MPELIDQTNKRDISSGVSEGIEFEHHEIHEGHGFTFQEGFALNDEPRYYLIQAADTKREPHIIITASGSQDTSVLFQEGSTLGGDTVLNVRNRNRRSNIPPQTRIWRGTTGVETGTLLNLFSAQWGIATASGGRGGAGGQAPGRHEFILARDTKYLLTITALSANVNNITVFLDWYEHLPHCYSEYLSGITD